MGLKWPPQSTFASVSPKLSDIQPCTFETLFRTPRAVYRRIKFCHISSRNVDMMLWNRKYIIGNRRKVVCPFVKLTITGNKHFHWLLSYFHGHLAWICCWQLPWFLDVNINAICGPGNMSCLSKFTDILLLSGYNYYRFRAWLWRHLIVIWRRHVPHDVVSLSIQFMAT